MEQEMQDFETLSFEVKDKCPKPDIFQSKNPHSVIIQTSEFKGLYFPQSGPSSLLSLLRQQYPNGNAIFNPKMVKVECGTRVEISCIEIAFDEESSREKALSTSFYIQDRSIKVEKTATMLPSKAAVRILIKTIQLADPSTYREQILNHLGNYGVVESLHLHYTEDGNWFKGDGCAILICDYDFKKSVETHPLLQFSFQYYPVLV